MTDYTHFAITSDEAILALERTEAECRAAYERDTGESAEDCEVVPCSARLAAYVAQHGGARLSWTVAPVSHAIDLEDEEAEVRREDTLHLSAAGQIAEAFLVGWDFRDARSVSNADLLASRDEADGSGLRVSAVAEQFGVSPEDVIRAVRAYLLEPA